MTVAESPGLALFGAPETLLVQTGDEEAGFSSFRCVYIPVAIQPALLPGETQAVVWNPRRLARGAGMARGVDQNPIFVGLHRDTSPDPRWARIKEPLTPLLGFVFRQTWNVYPETLQLIAACQYIGEVLAHHDIGVDEESFERLIDYNVPLLDLSEARREK